MLFFYKDYDEFSKLATFLSRIGGICYAFTIISIILFIQSQDMSVIFAIPILLLFGFGLNKWAEKIVKNKKEKFEKTLENKENLNSININEPKIKTIEQWKCTNCGNINTGKFCAECGKEKVNRKFCSNCGEKIEDNVKFCGNCGNKI